MKIINVDTGSGRQISPLDLAKIKKAIHRGLITIDLGEAEDFQGDFCLDDMDYTAALSVIEGS